MPKLNFKENFAVSLSKRLFGCYFGPAQAQVALWVRQLWSVFPSDLIFTQGMVGAGFEGTSTDLAKADSRASPVQLSALPWKTVQPSGRPCDVTSTKENRNTQSRYVASFGLLKAGDSSQYKMGRVEK